MWIVNLFDSFFILSLFIFLCSFLESTYWPTVLHNHQPIFSVGKFTFCLCLCAIARFNTPRLVEHIFAAIHRWNTEHTKYQAHISMIYYFFPHLFFSISFFIHLKWAGRFHSKNILLLLRAVVFSWKSFVVFVIRSCYHFASFIN